METLATLSPSDSAEEEASASAAAAEHESGRREKRRKLLDSVDALPPQDVIMYGIVARLPATTAARLRLVSKAWSATIRTRGFSERQSSLARLPDAIVLVCPIYPGCRLENLYLVDLAAASASFAPPREVKLGCCRSGMAGYNLVGACHGLVCFCRDHRLLVINPITGQTLRLNSSAAAAAGATLTSNYYLGYLRCGFGFDPDRKEYKIVRIMFDETARKAVDAEVCAFNLDELQVQYDDDSDSNDDGERRWRRTVPLPAEINKCPSGRALVNGNFHWVIRNDPPPRQILAFNVRDEGFRMLPAPPEAGLNDFWQLAELGGRLAYVDSRGWRLLGVWIMDEYGRGDSWRHAFDLEVGFESDEWLPFVLGYWKGDTGKLLMKAGKRLCLYDLRTGKKDFTLLRFAASSSQPNDVHDISFVTGRLY